mmetsp:Transcript_41962/g.105841  ORF Transcript_41962/g.105841 Transcript_41962/m.105841 type:complete len:228 (+) Transcript_41962:1334-2017(+)
MPARVRFWVPLLFNEVLGGLLAVLVEVLSTVAVAAGIGGGLCGNGVMVTLGTTVFSATLSSGCGSEKRQLSLFRWFAEALALSFRDDGLLEVVDVSDAGVCTEVTLEFDVPTEAVPEIAGREGVEEKLAMTEDRDGLLLITKKLDLFFHLLKELEELVASPALVRAELQEFGVEGLTAVGGARVVLRAEMLEQRMGGQGALGGRQSLGVQLVQFLERGAIEHLEDGV